MDIDKRLAAVAAQREELIAKFGWMVQSVFPTAESPGDCFAYSIGLHTQGLPELIALGLPMEVGTALINDVARQLLAHKVEGRGLPIGQMALERWPMPVYLLEADASTARELAVGADRRSAGQANYVQLCWPDKGGHFPWEAACSPAIQRLQALLGPPPVVLH